MIIDTDKLREALDNHYADLAAALTTAQIEDEANIDDIENLARRFLGKK
jgi:hypothetical protein